MNLLIHIHDALYQFLQDFDEFCKENDVDYSVYAGTLLGAVRHQGFIPWDDDIDLSIDRAQFERLVPLWNASRTTELKIHYDGIWVPRIAVPCEINGKTINLYVDFFVHDPSGIGPFFYVKVAIQLVYRELFKLANKIRSRPVRVEADSLKGFGFYRFMISSFNTISSFNFGKSSESSGYVHSPYDPMKWMIRRMPKEIFETYERTRFRDMMVPKVTKHHELLTFLYNDTYMTPPKMADRVPGHLRNQINDDEMSPQ